MKFFVNLIYTYRYKEILASRNFPKAKNYVVCVEFQMASKLHFPQWKFYFSQSIFIDKYLRFKELEYLNHYVNFEM